MSESVTRAHAKERPTSRPRPGGHKTPSHLSPPISRGGRFVGLDFRFMISLKHGQLDDAEFRAFLALAAYVSQYRAEVNADGTWPARWHTFAAYTRAGKRPGKVTKRHIARFLELGLLEELIDTAGEEFLRFRDWRSLCPRDATNAERAARYRERHALYGRRPRRYDDPPAAHELEIPPHREERA